MDDAKLLSPEKALRTKINIFTDLNINSLGYVSLVAILPPPNLIAIQDTQSMLISSTKGVDKVGYQKSRVRR